MFSIVGLQHRVLSKQYSLLRFSTVAICFQPSTHLHISNLVEGKRDMVLDAKLEWCSEGEVEFKRHQGYPDTESEHIK